MTPKKDEGDLSIGHPLGAGPSSEPRYEENPASKPPAVFAQEDAPPHPLDRMIEERYADYTNGGINRAYDL